MPDENKMIELIKLHKKNPIKCVEYFMGVKLHWYQKLLFKYWYKKPNCRK